MAGQRAQNRALLLAHPAGGGSLGRRVHRVGPRPAQVLHDQPQHLEASVCSRSGPLLKPIEHLNSDQRWHAGQAYLTSDHAR